MKLLRFVPVVLASLLLAAHFFRGGQILLVLLSLALPCVLPLRRRWVPVVITLALLLGALEWLHTLASIAALRIELGLPWVRMAIILGSVSLLTGLSPLVFRTRSLRQWYGRSADVVQETE